MKTETTQLDWLRGWRRREDPCRLLSCTIALTLRWPTRHTTIRTQIGIRALYSRAMWALRRFELQGCIHSPRRVSAASICDASDTREPVAYTALNPMWEAFESFLMALTLGADCAHHLGGATPRYVNRLLCPPHATREEEIRHQHIVDLLQLLGAQPCLCTDALRAIVSERYGDIRM